MKICHLIDTLAMGGAEKVAVLHSVELVRRGHDVTLIAYHSGNGFHHYLDNSGVRVHVLSAGGFSRLAALRQAMASPFDVVHAYKLPAMIWGSMACALTRRSLWFAGQHALTPDSAMVRHLSSAMGRRIAGWIVPSRSAAAAVRRDFRTPGQNSYPSESR